MSPTDLGRLIPPGPPWSMLGGLLAALTLCPLIAKSGHKGSGRIRPSFKTLFD